MNSTAKRSTGIVFLFPLSFFLFFFHLVSTWNSRKSRQATNRYDHLQFHEVNNDTSTGKFRYREYFDNVVRSAAGCHVARHGFWIQNANLAYGRSPNLFRCWFTEQEGNNTRMGMFRPILRKFSYTGSWSVKVPPNLLFFGATDVWIERKEGMPLDARWNPDTFRRWQMFARLYGQLLQFPVHARMIIVNTIL